MKRGDPTKYLTMAELVNACMTEIAKVEVIAVAHDLGLKFNEMSAQNKHLFRLKGEWL